MNRLVAAVSSLTVGNVPRRIACLVMITKKTSTRFSQEPEVGVQCRVIRATCLMKSRDSALPCLS